jgi:hypothetical protein
MESLWLASPMREIPDSLSLQASCPAKCDPATCFPVGALDASAALDRQVCYERLLAVSRQFEDLGPADACGKCAVGPCALEAAT